MVGDGPGPAVQASKALGEVQVHPSEVGLGLLNLPLGDGEGDVLLLYKVVALRCPLGEDTVGLPAILVQVVPPLLHEDSALEVHAVQAAVDDGDFGGGVCGQGVEDAAVGGEDAPLVLLGGGGVVDVGKAPSAAVLAANEPDAVRADAPDGDGLLDAAGDVEGVPLAPVGGGEGFNQGRCPPFALRGCSGSFRRQSAGLRRRGVRT